MPPFLQIFSRTHRSMALDRLVRRRAFVQVGISSVDRNVIVNVGCFTQYWGIDNGTWLILSGGL